MSVSLDIAGSSKLMNTILLLSFAHPSCSN